MSPEPLLHGPKGAVTQPSEFYPMAASLALGDEVWPLLAKNFWGWSNIIVLTQLMRKNPCGRIVRSYLIPPCSYYIKHGKANGGSRQEKAWRAGAEESRARLCGGLFSLLPYSCTSKRERSKKEIDWKLLSSCAGLALFSVLNLSLNKDTPSLWPKLFGFLCICFLICVIGITRRVHLRSSSEN